MTLQDNALTTDAPTPCKPPLTLYAPPPNLPPACKVVMTVSRADRPVVACLSTGIPLPLSVKAISPSSEIVIVTVSQNPAIASSTQLSKIS